MAYTSPKTWAAGDILTAAEMNTHLRDNLLAVATTGGLLLHEAGGMEINISGVADGGVMRGTGAGTWAILASFLDTNGRVRHEYGGLEIALQGIAKASLLAPSATGTWTSLAVGANGKVLTAASGESTGLQWTNADTTTTVDAAVTVNNSTTFVNIPGLAFTVEANKNYIWEIHFQFTNASGSNTSKFQFTVPSGCVINASFVGDNAAGDQVKALKSGAVVTLIGPGRTGPTVMLAQVITASTGGTVQLQFAQNSAESYDHIVLTDALMRIRESA